MAQQASPNVIGQSDESRAQLRLYPPTSPESYRPSAPTVGARPPSALLPCPLLGGSVGDDPHQPYACPPCAGYASQSVPRGSPETCGCMKPLTIRPRKPHTLFIIAKL